MENLIEVFKKELPDKLVGDRRVPLQFGSAPSPTYRGLIEEMTARTNWGVSFARLIWLQVLHVIQHSQPEVLADMAPFASQPWVIVIKHNRPGAGDEFQKAASAVWGGRDKISERCRFDRASTWQAVETVVVAARLNGARVIVVSADKPAEPSAQLDGIQMMIWLGVDQESDSESIEAAARELFRHHLHDDLGEAAVTFRFAQAEPAQQEAARDLARALFRESEQTRPLRQLAVETARDVIQRFVSKPK